MAQSSIIGRVGERRNSTFRSDTSGCKTGSFSVTQVVALLFDLAVITARERSGIPHARCELLPKMNVTKPDVLCLQAAHWFQRILRASADQRLPTAHSCSRHPEMPKEQLEEAGPTLKSSIEFLQLLAECFLEEMLAASANELRFLRIRENRYCERIKLDELGLGA
jgi:hypothetical protein